MTAVPALIVQGTGSHAGKSTIVAGLCRALKRRGIRVVPFKPQNMSNNAAVTADGGEIGRAQALQARAAGIQPTVHMNPVLLKPESETGAQIVVQGRRFGTMRAGDYGKRKSELLPKVLESFEIVSRNADLVLVEGAGSPAEVNLREGDIANMGFAEAAELPAILVGDIDRGGVIANLVGTHALLPAKDAQRIEGFLINKMRGDMRLFDEGVRTIEQRTGWTCLGTIPWFDGATALPAEDVLGLTQTKPQDARATIIAVPRLRRVANFDDLDPLRLETNVEVVIVAPGQPIPAKATLVLIPGSKSTIADLAFLRQQGWDVDILAHIRRGGHVLGLCGGYQMLGQAISDPDGIEGPAETVAGLGHLDVETTLTADKTTVPVTGRHVASGGKVTGYEIHLGRTDGPDRARALFELDGRREGSQSSDGLASGTYVHGLFADDEFRRTFLASLGAGSDLRYDAMIESTLDALAEHLEAHVAVDRLLEIAGYRQNRYAITKTAIKSKAHAPR